MGVFDIDLKIANPVSPVKSESVRLMVDTGATMSAIPRPILRSLGIAPGMKRVFELANGDTIERDTGFVLATTDGITMPINVMFAEEGDALVLGATALEVLGLVVDPVKGELVPRRLLAPFRKLL